MSFDKITALLGKGSALTAADVREIQYHLSQMPANAAHEAGEWVWEGVALIVNDNDYRGDAKLPEPAESD